MRNGVKIVLIAMGLMLPVAAMAQEKIAVVDAQRIISESNAAKKAVNELNKMRTSSQAKLEKMEKDINGRTEELKKKRSVMSDDQVLEAETSLKADVRKYRTEVTNLQEQLNNELALRRKEIITALRNVVNDLAAQNKYQMVIDRSQLLYTSSGIDVTDEVMKRVNKALDK